MLLKCTLGERPTYVAHFPDGTEVALPQGVGDALDAMGRFTGLGGKRLKDIGSVEELAAALDAFCREVAAIYAQAADALPWAVLRLGGRQAGEGGQ